MDSIVEIKSISDLHEILGYEKPTHPLVTWIDLNQLDIYETYRDQAFTMDFYTIMMKKGEECKVKYGQDYYDFSEGSMVFAAPGQVMVVDYEKDANEESWMLVFHPDLITGTPLHLKMSAFTFFRYEAVEALHLSEIEKKSIVDLVATIKHEYSQNIDGYTRDLIVSGLELLLNYCNRYYGRQFLTRTTVNKTAVAVFESKLKEALYDNTCTVPTVKYIAGIMGYSPNYLSDMLKKETGKTASEHIQKAVIDRAKSLLSSTKTPVAEISVMLGFDYAAHFSKFFSKHMGTSPSNYRKQFTK